MYKCFKICGLIFFVLVSSFYIPKFYKSFFAFNTGKTYLFYSPVIKKFIYREMTGQGHQFDTRDEDGNEYTRQEYESLIPFIYYKNMDIWGKLPLEIDGRVYNKEFIRQNRQVFQLNPKMLGENYFRENIYPLLESKPKRARLMFEENCFKFTNNEMLFINTDSNKREEKLTNIFTTALNKAGFIFPAKKVFGKVSILKPFDEGYFVVDDKEQLFHIKKINSKPFVRNTRVKVDSGIRYINVSENSKKNYYGLLLSNSGSLFFLTYDNYSLIKIPCKNYNPDEMEIKILLNPVNNTVIYSNEKYIYGVAADKNFNELRSYKKLMYMGKEKLSDKVFSFIFPFYFQGKTDFSSYIIFKPFFTSSFGLLGTLVSLAVFICIRKKRIKNSFFEIGFICFTGIYGFLAVLLGNSNNN